MSKKESGKGISRRLFLKGTALSGAVKAAFPSQALAAKKKSAEARKGKSEHALTLRINGEKRKVQVHTDETLAEVLRDHLQPRGPPCLRPCLWRMHRARGLGEPQHACHSLWRGYIHRNG